MLLNVMSNKHNVHLVHSTILLQPWSLEFTSLSYSSLPSPTPLKLTSSTCTPTTSAPIKSSSVAACYSKPPVLLLGLAGSHSAGLTAQGGRNTESLLFPATTVHTFSRAWAHHITSIKLVSLAVADYLPHSTAYIQHTAYSIQLTASSASASASHHIAETSHRSVAVTGTSSQRPCHSLS